MNKTEKEAKIESIEEFEKRYLPTLFGTSEQSPEKRRSSTESFGSLLASDLTDNIRRSLKKALND